LPNPENILCIWFNLYTNVPQLVETYRSGSKQGLGENYKFFPFGFQHVYY